VKYIFQILILISTSVMGECIFLEKESEIRAVDALRTQANIVMEAEGIQCAHLKGRAERSACQCLYRDKPLVIFRKKHRALLKDKPDYATRMVCYTQNNKGISVNFIAYQHIQVWCM
jgi:hypothetical protein